MKIELGENMDEMCAPAQSTSEKETKKWYPRLEVRTEEKLPDIPDEGTAIIHFIKVREAQEQKDDKKKYSCDLEVHAVEFKGFKKKSTRMSDEEAVDKGLDEAMNDEGDDNADE